MGGKGGEGTREDARENISYMYENDKEFQVVWYVLAILQLLFVVFNWRKTQALLPIFSRKILNPTLDQERYVAL